jgi:hypothetical protein
MDDADNKKGAESEMWDNAKDPKVEFSDYELTLLAASCEEPLAR